MFISPRHLPAHVWSPIDNRSLAARFPLLSLTVGDVDKLADRMPIVIPTESHFGTPLPVALVTPTQTANPFGEHTPLMIQDYPFQLASQALCVNDAGDTVNQDALWADPTAPHWQTSPENGYRLFDDHGEPSEALKDVLARLQAVNAEIARTQEFMALLMQAGVLWQQQVQHLGQMYAVFKVELTDGLSDKLEALDSAQAGQALWLAERIAESQQSLDFFPPPPAPYGMGSPYGMGF